MRIFTRYILLYSIILSSISGLAKQDPPVPAQNQVQARQPDPQPLKIDSNLILLTLAGTLLGIYIIRKHKTDKKRPI